MKGLNMKTKTMIAMLLGLGLSAGSIAFAQDAEVPPQTVSDPGVEAVREAQEIAVPAPKKSVTPSKVLQAIADEKGWNTSGWDPERKRFITISYDDVDTDNPAADEDFFLKREAAARRAYLKAKAKIIEFVSQKMSASDCLFIPGTDLNAAFNKEMKEIEAKMVEEKEKLAKILDRYNRAEAAELRGTTFSDRMNDLLVAVIKKIDDTYDKDANDAKLKAQLDEARQNLEEQKARFEKIRKEAEAMKGSLKREQSSEVVTMASMPLYGASVMMQTEGFDKKYQVAMIVVWSPALERAARAIVTGEDYKLTPKENGSSMKEWIKKQNLSSMIGPRTFLDKDGRRWFVGISADEYNDDMDSVDRDQAEMFAEQFAKSAVAFSVMGDVESYKAAKMMANTYRDASGGSQEKARKSMEVRLSQTIQDKTIRGLQPITSDTVDHPISNREMFVSVYAISPDSAKDALEVEKENYATKVQQEHYQTVEKGRQAANQAAVEAAKNRQEDFQKGASEQGQAITRELQKREAEKNKNSGIEIKINQPAPSTKPSKPAESTRGVFGGDTDVSDDF